MISTPFTSIKTGILVGITIFNVATPGYSSEPVKFAYAQEGYEPFYYPENSPKKGIFNFIIEATCKRAHLECVARFLPQKRKFELFTAKEIDVELGVNPVWRKDFEDISVYTSPFMTSEDIAIYRPSDKNPGKTSSDFKGKTIGTFTGFYYPTIESGFADKSITRFDFKDETAMLKTLALEGKEKRIDLAVMNRLSAKYFSKELKIPLAFGNTLDKTDIMFRFHKDNKESFEKFNNALKAELDAGLMKKIIKEMNLN